MAVKKNNPHVRKMMELAGSIATDSNSPFFGMVESLAFAVADKAITEQREFKDLIQSLRTHKGVPTLAENRLSETWSCGELGGFACVKPLFKAMRALPTLPSMTGLYDIACSMRDKGSFGKNGDNAGKGLGSNGWDSTSKTTRADAPTTAQLQAAMKHANVARNKGKVQAPRSFAEEIESMIKRLEKLTKGYDVARNGKTVKVPANPSPHLVDAAGSLRKLIASNVVKLPAKNGKRAARA